jgi:hypothetical protein
MAYVIYRYAFLQEPKNRLKFLDIMRKVIMAYEHEIGPPGHTINPMASFR